ncbi:uncharacterized protein LOC120193215 [Hibiscus syriacus]|uniref:uncharacterized protein LOC120193215 n=1 Tax=Hibiscus syriacus TaxID=106335 RepID=UPI0019241ADF|nr:uncharacterized protein LOC120193215 [Hibiscus syriacus]
MTPTIEEYRALIRCPRFQVDKVYTKPPNTPSFKKKLILMTGMSEEWVMRGIKKKGDREYVTWTLMRDLINCHPGQRKKIDFFALGIYGLVIFPRVLGHIDVSVVDLFERLDRHVDPVPAILAETFRSLSSCRREGEGRFIGCAPLLLTWILSHFKHVERAPGRWPGSFTEEKWMIIFKSIRDSDILWRTSWNVSSDILYRCGDRDWVPLPGIWGSVGYAPLLVSRQFGSRQFIPATRELSKSEFAFRGELYKNKVKGVTDAWRYTHRVNLFTFESRLSRGYEEWRSNRVNDNIPLSNQENIQSMEEHLRVIPSPLEQARLDFEAERKKWRVTLQKLEDEVYQKGLETDIQKSRADQIEKVEKQLRLDFNDLHLSH